MRTGCKELNGVAVCGKRGQETWRSANQIHAHITLLNIIIRAQGLFYQFINITSMDKKGLALDYTSCDAPPLDFSFKNIKNLQDIKVTQPRQGTRLNPVDEDGKPLNPRAEEKEEEQETVQEKEKNEAEGKNDKKKQEITRLLPENNISSVVNSMINTSAMRNISTKAKEELEKQKKKSIQVKLVCCSLILSYNKIRELHKFPEVIVDVMPSHTSLQWLDLSHNFLQTIDYDFSHYPQLRTLYLHCNFIADIGEFQKLQKHENLKTFMVHGNPLTEVPNFRSYIISVLPNLKKIDSVLVSKKEKDNAIFLRTQIKKFPLPKNPAKPPVEKNEEEDEEKDLI